MAYKTPCQLGDPERWFPLDEDGPSSAEARQGCARCLAREYCLAVALSLDEPPVGIWGGTSTAERDALRRRPRGRAA